MSLLLLFGGQGVTTPIPIYNVATSGGSPSIASSGGTPTIATTGGTPSIDTKGPTG